MHLKTINEKRGCMRSLGLRKLEGENVVILQSQKIKEIKHEKLKIC